MKTTIFRGQGPLPIQGVRVSTLAALLKSISEPPSTWVVADMVLGAWRGHWIASEFGKQLGWPTSADVPTLEAHDFTHYAGTIARHIDLETSGDQTVLQALALASRIVADTSPTVFLIIAPRFGMPWENENIWLLRFLAQGLNSTLNRLVLIATGPDTTPLPEDFLIEWQGQPDYIPTAGVPEMQDVTPGLLERTVIQELGICLDHQSGIELSNGNWLVAPERRQNPRKTPRLLLTQLAVSVTVSRWLSAYGHFFGHECSADLRILLSEADARSSEGGGGIALRLFERAAELATSQADKIYACMRAQGPLIVQSRFEDLARMPKQLDENVPLQARRYYIQNRSWGLVMTGRWEEAKQGFSEVQRLFGSEVNTPEYLYLLNISALACLRLGDLQGAIAREREIESKLAITLHRDWHLEYINSLNIGRLMRLLGDHESAEAYFHRAFSTCAGLRSTPDLIAMNFYLGHTLAARGRLAEALEHWIRGALHWVAYGVPEALPIRVLKLVTGRATVPQNSVEEISLAWSRILEKTLRDLSIYPKIAERFVYGMRHQDASPTFVETGTIDSMIPPHPVHAIGVPGWGILGLKKRMRPQWTGAAHESLRRLLHAFLADAAPPIEGLQTIFIDSRFGRGMPASVPELVEVSLRHNVIDIDFAGHRQTLSKPLCAELRRATHFRWAEGLNRVVNSGTGEIQIVFKRYLPPLTLTASEREAVAVLEAGQSGETRQLNSSNLDHAWNLISGLERRRVVDVLISADKVLQLF